VAKRTIRNREIADARSPGPVTRGVKEIASVQPPAAGQPLVRGGTTSGSPGELVRFWNRWRENYNALLALTIGRVRYLNEMTQRGDHAYPQWTYRTIERRHPVLSALITCCESPLENFNWDVVIKKELPQGFTEADAEKQQEALKNAYGQIDNLKEAITHLAHADFAGYSHLQKHHGANGTDVVHLEPLYQYCICRDGLFGDWFWNPDSRAMTMPEFVLTEKNRIGGEMLPREDFIIREVPRPINEIALENFVRRKLIEKDWSAFGELFGLPSGVIVMPSGIPPELVAIYEATARMIAEAGTGAAPAGSEWKPNTPPHDGSALFKLHMSSLDEDLVLAGTGGKLKMLVEQGHGGTGGGGGGGGNVRGSSKTQAETFMVIAQARGGKVSACFNEDFDRPFLAVNFPGQPVLVEFKLVTEDDKDIGEICQNVASLATVARPDIPWLNEITGYKFEAAPDPVVQSPKSNVQSPEGTDAEKNLTLKNRYAGAPVHPEVAAHFAEALAEDLAPLRSALAAIEGITDDTLFEQKMREFISDHGPLVKLLADINAYPKSAKVIEKMNTQALVAGLSGKPEVKV
jgi:hypothetical protein